MFRFLLVLEDNEPEDPPALVTVVPNWTVGEAFSRGDAARFRILGIETEIAVELVERGFHGVLTVEAA